MSGVRARAHERGLSVIEGGARPVASRGEVPALVCLATMRRPSASVPCIVRPVSAPVLRVTLPDERGLCDRAKAGDRAALGVILRTYGPLLYRTVLLPRLGSDAAAQDALAETYARVVERFDLCWTGAYSCVVARSITDQPQAVC